MSDLKLLCDTDIEIKKADKGSTFVIMDKCFYRDKLVLRDHLHTQTYKEVPSNCDENVIQDLKRLMVDFRDCLTDKEFK